MPSTLPRGISHQIPFVEEHITNEQTCTNSEQIKVSLVYETHAWLLSICNPLFFFMQSTHVRQQAYVENPVTNITVNNNQE